MNRSLDNLKNLFVDRPDVLRMLRRNEMDLQELTDAELVESYRTKELFPEPVNLYVTGRTHAGKSTLGNRFLAGNPLPSTGRQDCTSFVQHFRLASNLVYFDLPGAGGSDDYENVNRAALLLEPFPDQPAAKVVPTLDFTGYLKSGHIPAPEDRVEVPIDLWKSDAYRKQFAPDVILYVVAPHALFLRTDRQYLSALLRKLSAGSQPVNLVFALNLFQNDDGGMKSTPQNIAGARESIAEIWRKYCSGEPPICEVNARTGKGLEALAKKMCDLLPPHKIGSMGEALAENLRGAAELERSRRFRKLLIGIASRLATFKVDATIGRDDLLRVALSALCAYGIEIFHEEQCLRDLQRDAVALLADAAASETRKDRAQAITILQNDVKEVEVTQWETVRVVPVIEQVEEYDEVPTIDVTQERKAKSTVERGFFAMLEGLTHGLFSPIGVSQAALGYNRTVHDEIAETFADAYYTDERVMSVKMKTVKRTRDKFVGLKDEKEEVTRKIPQLITREEQVGTEYLYGGSRVVEDVFALGLAIEKLPTDSELSAKLEDIVADTRNEVRRRLEPLKAMMDASAAAPDPEAAERQLTGYLTPLFSV